MNDYEQAQKLFNVLWKGGQYAFFWTTPDKQSWWFGVDSIPAQLKATKRNLYFGVHPVTEIPKTSATGQPRDPHYVRSQLAYVAAINCLFAEFDAKDHADGKPGALAALQITAPPASVIVDSGGGYHAYWLLDKPLLINDTDTREYARKLQHRWVGYVGGDKGAKDLCRVLRVPGSVNYKNEYAPDFPRVEFVRFLDRTYNLHELAAALPSEPRRRPRPVVLGSTDDMLTRVAAWIVRASNGARNDTLNRAAFALRSYVNSGNVDRYEAEEKLLTAALAAGLPEREALATIASGLGG